MYAIANDYGYEKFIELMNKKSAELGMHDSYFTNPVGFDDENNYSTVFDLYLLLKEALRNEVFTEIVNMPRYDILSVAGKEYAEFNTNKLLKNELLEPYIYGIKTGTTYKAGECLTFLYKRNGVEIIGVLLGSTDRYRDAEMAIGVIQKAVRKLGK
jgi:D-alanyl-D-alanine carboxypeptidase (penicillin-binding protein 5/6)